MLAKTPVTIVTGFLGAGKTTLIRHLLGQRRRAAARAHHQRIRRRRRRRRPAQGLRRRGLPARRRSSNSPTAASAARSPTISPPRVTALLAREPKPDHIVIETSGLALPKPLVKAFDWPELRTRLTVDGVIAVVDAAAVADGRFADDPARVAEQRAADPSLDHDNPLEEVYEDQLLCADLVVLNKADLVDAGAARTPRAPRSPEPCRARSRSRATREGVIEPDVLLGVRAAAEDDLAARPSHHDAEGEHDHDDFDTFVVAIPAGRRSRRADRAADRGDARRTTSCASRASSRSPASRCGCWCRASAGASAATSTGPGAPARRATSRARRDRREGRRPRRRSPCERSAPDELLHVPCTSPASRSGRSTRRSKRSISARRRRMSCFCRSPTATSTRSRAPTTPPPEPKPTLRLASARGAAPSLFDRPLSRARLRAREAGRRARARRRGLLALRRRRTGGAGAPERRQAGAAAGRPARATRGSTRPRRSTREAVERIWRYFDEGGPDNHGACLAFFAAEIGAAASAPPPAPVDAFGRFERACFEAAPGAPRALIVFYRSIYLADDLAPIEALAQALRDKGFATTSVYVTSLKDEAALAPLRALLDRRGFRRRAQRDRLFRAARRTRGDGARRARRAGAAGRAGRRRRRGLARLAARPRARRSRDACRAAGDRRANPHPRHLVQGGEPRDARDRIRRGRAPAARRSRRLRRRARRAAGRA